jgi:hypothetical protein
MKLKPFGAGCSSEDYGFDLPTIVSHLENMVNTEEASGNGPRARRLAKVEDAVQLLNAALEMGGEL